jgi:hypothetical protein
LQFLHCAAGAEALDKWAAAFAANSSSIGGCLLGDLPLEPPPELAISVLQKWHAASTAAAAAGTDGTEALLGLASMWQPPAFPRKPNKLQLAAVDRLRGLVLLGRAAASVQAPDEVLQVRLMIAKFTIRPQYF